MNEDFNNSSNTFNPPKGLRQIFALTIEGSNEQKELLKYLDNVQFNELSNFFKSFLKGTLYVYTKFGATFDEVIINTGSLTIGEKTIQNPTIGIIQDKSDIANVRCKLLIPVKEISEFILTERDTSKQLTSPIISPHTVSSFEMVTLIAVEEAYHCYQLHTNSDKYEAEAHITEHGPNYSEKLIEREAEYVVREYIKLFGTGQMSIDQYSKIEHNY